TNHLAPPAFKSINIVEDVDFEPYGCYFVALMLQGDLMADKELSSALKQATLGDVQHDGLFTVQELILPGRPNRPPVRFYFNTNDHLLVKVKQRIRTVQVTERFQDIHTNQPIPDSVFKFTPPASARLVDKLPSTQAGENR